MATTMGKNVINPHPPGVYPSAPVRLMHTALIVHSDYAQVPGFPSVPSSPTNADWFARRLAEPDAGFEVHRLVPDARVVKHLRAIAKTRGGPGSAMLFAFFGYLVLTEAGEPALLLDEANVASLPLSRLKKFLARFSHAQVVLDVVLGTSVAGVEPALAPRVVSDQLINDLAQSNCAALVAIRPWGTPDSVAATPFTSLAMHVLSNLAELRETISTGQLYSAMCQHTAAVSQVPGIGCATSNPEFQLLPGLAEVAAPAFEHGAMTPAHSLRMSVFPAAAPPSLRPPPVMVPSEPAPPVRAQFGERVGAAGIGEGPTPAAPGARLPELAAAPSRAAVSRAESGRLHTRLEAEDDVPPPRPPAATAQDIRVEREAARLCQLGDEHSARGDYFAAQHEYQHGLAVAFTAGQRSRMLSKLAAVQRALGNDEQALEHLSEAIRGEPFADGAYEALADLLREKSAEDADAFYQSLRATMSTREPKIAVMRAALRFWKDVVHDRERALMVVERLVSEMPREREFHTALEQLTSGEHSHLRSEILRRAAEVQSDPPAKAELLMSAASAMPGERSNPKESVGLARQVLALDPTNVAALEQISTSLAQAGDWQGLASTYENFLASDVSGVAASRLATALAKICLGKLGDKHRAAVAYEAAVRLDPGNVALRHDLAGLYESLDEHERAGVHYRVAVQTEPLNANVLRRAFAYFGWVKDADSAWTAACALTFLQRANDREAQLAQAYARDGLLAPRRSLNQDDWETCFAGQADPAVLEFLAAISAAALSLRMPTARRERQLLERYTEMDPEANTTTLARTLLWTSQLLAQPAPKILLTDEAELGVQVAAVSVPAALASKALGRGLTLAQLTFLWARALSMLRPQHYLFAFYSDAEALRELVATAMITAEVTIGNEYEPGTRKSARTLRRELKDSDLQRLQAVALRGPASELERRLVEHKVEIDRSCLRVGMVACGSLQIALELTKRFPLGGELTVEQQLSELIRFGLSDSYRALRHSLGVSVA